MQVRLLRPFACQFCNIYFNSFDKFKIHVLRHKNKLLRRPRHNNSISVYQWKWNDHKHFQPRIRSQTRDKLNKCGYSHYSYALKSKLTRYIMTHMKEKHYQCDYCQKGFARKSDLTRHIRTRTNPKPYKCDYCQRRFVHKHDFTRHVRTHITKTYV